MNDGAGQSLSDRWNAFQADLAKTCEQLDRPLPRICCVTKTVEVPKILEGYHLGMRCFGENKVQELLSKVRELPRDIEWHFIGRLQLNKVKYLLGEFVDVAGSPPMIQSLDRFELAEQLEKQAEKRGLESLNCLLQVNCSGETTKAGFSLGEARDFLENFQFKRVKIKGLMTIGPHSEDEGLIRESFMQVSQLRDQCREMMPAYDFEFLSMGMSGDYVIALESGSDMIRVGSRIFGERVYS